MKSKRTKRSKTVKRQSKWLIKLRSWGGFIDEAYQLESSRMLKLTLSCRTWKTAKLVKRPVMAFASLACK
jgi:hypothetical protein